MKLIAGLGNPGRRYQKTRHNLGFMCLNRFGRTQGIKLNKNRFRARVGLGKVADNEVILARPQTYVNSSGESISRLVNRYKISLDDLIVIHDDLDLPTGKIRIRRGGGSGGHKGVESVTAELGSPDYYRVRIGIGRPPATEDSPEITEDDIIDYVLSEFTPEEKKIITNTIPVVSEAVLFLITEGLTAAMNKYN
jgi:PTH1 family peptidyl-tRNA hydrolase